MFNWGRMRQLRLALPVRRPQEVEEPELIRLLNAIVLEPDIPEVETRRVDIASILLLDVINVASSTDRDQLVEGGPSPSKNLDDDGFSRLSIFGGDVLTSNLQDGYGEGTLPGGFPNGRRLADEVLDIAVTATISDLSVSNLVEWIRSPGG